jgi:hypothetical protein
MDKKRLCQVINHEIAIKYLMANGWENIPPIFPQYTEYQYYQNSNQQKVVVPTDPIAYDYESRLLDVFNALKRIEKRDRELILFDMLNIKNSETIQGIMTKSDKIFMIYSALITGEKNPNNLEILMSKAIRLADELENAIAKSED